MNEAIPNRWRSYSTPSRSQAPSYVLRQGRMSLLVTPGIFNERCYPKQAAVQQNGAARSPAEKVRERQVMSPHLTTIRSGLFGGTSLQS